MSSLLIHILAPKRWMMCLLPCWAKPDSRVLSNGKADWPLIFSNHFTTKRHWKQSWQIFLCRIRKFLIRLPRPKTRTGTKNGKKISSNRLWSETVVWFIAHFIRTCLRQNMISWSIRRWHSEQDTMKRQAWLSENCWIANWPASRCWIWAAELQYWLFSHGCGELSLAQPSISTNGVYATR